MKHWNLLVSAVNGFLLNVESIGQVPGAKLKVEQSFETIAKQLKNHAKRFNEKPFRNVDESIHYFIHRAKEEISENLVHAQKRDLTIKKVEVDYDKLTMRLNTVRDKYELNHVKHKGTFYSGYFDKIQPIHNFYNWFLVETDQYRIENGKYIKNSHDNPATQDQEKMKITKNTPGGIVRTRTQVYRITTDNIDEIYHEHLNKYFCLTSDRVKINGEEVERDDRGKFYNKDEKGNSNILSLQMCKTIGGFPITEMDFINHELSYISTEGIDDLHRRKQAEVYLNFLLKRKGELDSNPIETPRQYPVAIFTSERSFRLFEYLLERYAIEKRIVQFSQIFHWMSEKKYVKSGSGTRFREYIINQELTKLKFARLADLKREERTILNDLEKNFDNQ